MDKPLPRSKANRLSAHTGAKLNKTHRSIYCISTGTWTAVSELVSAKTSGLTRQSTQAGFVSHLPAAAVAITAALSLSPVAIAADLVFQNSGSRTITIGLGGNTSAGTTQVTNTATGNLAVSADNGIAVTGSSAGFVQSLVVNNEGVISTTGLGKGITVETRQAADTIQVQNSGTIVTNGGNGSHGIASYAVGTGNTNITNFGVISTQGGGSSAIFAASSGGGDIDIMNGGAIETLGTQSSGIYASNSGAGLSITNTSTITTREQESSGIYATAMNGASGVSVSNLGTITTRERVSRGIQVTAWGDSVATDIEVINSGNITTSGPVGVGISTYNTTRSSTSRINNTGRITTTGDAGQGINSITQADNSNIVVTNTGAISTAGGSGSAGIFALTSASGGSNSMSIINAGSISTLGLGAHGIAGQASQGGNVEITSSGRIVTSGESSAGISVGHSSGGGAVAIHQTGGTIATSGTRSAGIKTDISWQATSQTIETSSSSSITTQGDGAPGIFAATSGGFSSTSVLIVNHAGSINTQGTSACAITTPSGCYSSLNSNGIFTNNHGPTQVTSSGQISVRGENADGVHMRDNIYSPLSGSSGVLAGLHDLRILGGSISGGWGTGAGIRTARAKNATITIAAGASVGALSDLAIRDADPGATSLSGPTQLVNNGVITGYVELRGGNDTFVNDSAGLLNLRNYADTNGDGVRDLKAVSITDLGGSTELVNHGRIYVATVPGSNGIEEARIKGLTTLLNAGGVISMGDATTGGSNAIAGDLLKIEGNYVGSSHAGREAGLVIDTQLGGDASATDRLHVTGNTSGSTRVTVNNAGGVGAATVNGIEVIRVDGTSAAGSFTLTAPVQAGAYEYNLFQGQPSSAADPVTNNDWYLRSGYKTTGSTTTTGVTPPPTSSPDPTPAPVIPYRPAIPGYLLGPQNQTERVFDMMGRLHQRIGDESDYFVKRTDAKNAKVAPVGTTVEQPEPAQAAQNENSTWARVGSRNLAITGNTRFAADFDVKFIQFGGTLFDPDKESQEGKQNQDAKQSQDEQSPTREYTGWTFSLVRDNSEFRDRMRGDAGLSADTGKLNGRTESIGITHTKFYENGRYLDLVANYNRHSNAYQDVYGGAAHQRGQGLSASIETGWKRELGDEGWQIEPQAQLQLQNNQYKEFSDSVSTVSSYSNKLGRARLGLRLASPQKPRENSTGGNHFYLTADLLKDLFKPNGIRVADVDIPSDFDRQTWVEIGIGGRLTVSESSWLYGTVQRQQGIGASAKKRSGSMVNVGLNVRW